MSCPARGTWIEIGKDKNKNFNNESCPARGTWIEIVIVITNRSADISRAPHGARGLKLFDAYISRSRCMSCPARGTWIEILQQSHCKAGLRVVPRTGHVD